MKRIILFTIVFISVYSCKKDKTENQNDPNRIVVTLIDKNDSIFLKQSVMLYDNFDYLIKTNLDSFINGYPFNIFLDYIDLKNKAIEDSKSSDILNVSDYIKNNSDSIYILADYLGSGKCFMFDKIASNNIKTIQMETYFSGGPMAAIGGRKFYVKGKLFLVTVDLISKK